MSSTIPPPSNSYPKTKLFPFKSRIPCHYQAQGINTGIAAAQNVGIRQALGAGASHVILFDQDSAPDAGMVQALLSSEAAVTSQGLPVAAVGPVFVDGRTGWVSPAVRYSFFGLRTIPVDLSKPAAGRGRSSSSLRGP